jgi:hypothetical protein
MNLIVRTFKNCFNSLQTLQFAFFPPKAPPQKKADINLSSPNRELDNAQAK